MTDYRMISPDYFAAMGMTLVKGRAFSRHDTEAAPGVVIINETLAARLFRRRRSDRETAGFERRSQRLARDRRRGGDVRNYGVDEEVKPEVYVPFFQSAAEYLASADFRADYRGAVDDRPDGAGPDAPRTSPGAR